MPQREGGGLPQARKAALLADLEAILLELRRRLDDYRALGADDVIAADEGYNFAAGLEVTLRDALVHAQGVRRALADGQQG
jgi:hypothetical protein